MNIQSSLVSRQLQEIIAIISVLKAEKFTTATRLFDQRYFLLYLGPFILRVKLPKKSFNKFITVRLKDGVLDIPELGMTLDDNVVTDVKYTATAKELVYAMCLDTCYKYTSDLVRWCQPGLTYYVNPKEAGKVAELIDNEIFKPRIMSTGVIVVKSVKSFRGNFIIDDNVLFFDNGNLGSYNLKSQFTIVK